MGHPSTFDETARHYIFFTAAWIANVDGHEDDTELDALCQLRKTLGIEPATARQLHQLARHAATRSPTGLEAA